MESVSRTDVPPDDPTLDQALDRFLEAFRLRVDRGVRSLATLGMHQDHAAIIRRSLPPGLRLKALTISHVAELAAAQVSGATVRKRLATLYGALEAARRRGDLATLPERPTVEYAYRPTTAHLRSVEELCSLCLELPIHRAEWVIAGVYTGMHSKNLNEWLAYLDVEPFAGWMVLRNSKNRKTDGLRVRIPKALGEVLRVRFGREQLAPGDLALATWDSGTRGHQLADAAARAGLEHRITATALRHTCGSWLVRRIGITPAVAKWMGHASTTMMERVYAHALPVQLEELTDELDSMGGPTEWSERQTCNAAPPVPPQQASDGVSAPSTAGNPTHSAVEREGPEGVSAPPGPATQRPRETRAPLEGDRTTGGHATRADRARGTSAVTGIVPRDRVELSTHGFSERSLPVATSLLSDALMDLPGRESPSCLDQIAPRT